MNLIHLQSLVCVVEKESFSIAAGLCNLTAECGEKKDFLMAHYDGVNPDELSYLREDVERNLRVLRSSDSQYLRYVCKEVLAIYQKSYRQANDEHLYEHDEECILKRTKELFMEGMNHLSV